MNYNIDFLKSTLTLNNPFNSIDNIKEWIKQRNDAVSVRIENICFNEMDKWRLDKEKGLLRHTSGKFFTIEGINVTTNWGKVKEWEQPIINQPEIGYLGIITREVDGILYFWLFADFNGKRGQMGSLA